MSYASNTPATFNETTNALMRHTVVIRTASTKCGNCSVDAELDNKNVCDQCGVKWMFTALAQYDPAQSLEEMKDEIEAEYPEQVFLGIGDGSVEFGTARFFNFA